ncbi:MAG: nucleoside triphosphate pyrophosphohydrolase [Leptospirillia bacterium]
MTFDPKTYLSHIARDPDNRATPVTTDPKDTTAVLTLLRIVDHLRGDNGCPFDRKQTLKGLLSDLKDEVYELEESLEDADLNNLSREMGDVFIILFMARRILWEQTAVSLGEILDGASLKMVSRHPHVFESPDPEKSLEAIWETWEEKKRTETVHQDRRSILDGIPRTMPALQASARLGQKAGRVGFDWPSSQAVFEKIEEECAEIQAATSEGPARLTEEIGDLLFAVAQFARLSGIRPEEALAEANKKFKRRFAFMEEQAAEENRALSSLSPKDWERLWENAKNRHYSAEGR